MQICQDVINHHVGNILNTGVNIALSANNLLYIKPIASAGARISFLLSDLISDILPKLKIVAIYHSTNNTVDIVPTVFIDDNSDNTPQQGVMSILPASSGVSGGITFGPGDVYHELTIARDAKIVWDACRELIS